MLQANVRVVPLLASHVFPVPADAVLITYFSLREPPSQAFVQFELVHFASQFTGATVCALQAHAQISFNGLTVMRIWGGNAIIFGAVPVQQSLGVQTLLQTIDDEFCFCTFPAPHVTLLQVPFELGTASATGKTKLRV